MGVYNKAADMPITCAGCFCCEKCTLRRKVVLPAHMRHPDCPLLEVSVPHGRLIEAGTLDYHKDDSGLASFDYVLRGQIEAAPTIIPEEEAQQWND